MTEKKLPSTTEELTEEWLTKALREAGIITESKVISFTASLIGQEWGFTGEISRIEPVYDFVEDKAPASLVVKFPNSSSEPLSAYKIKKNKSEKSKKLHVKRCKQEILFYRHLAKDAGIGTPEMYYSESDPGSGVFVLLLEDIKNASIGDALKGCSPGEAEIIIKEMAKFHSKWWNSPNFKDFSWLNPYWGSDWQVRKNLYEQRLEQFLARFGHMLPLYVRDIMTKLSYCYGNVIQKLAKPPFTMVHRDLHLDNIFLNTGNDHVPVIVIDWQSVGIGRGVIEFANFLFVSLNTEEKRACEKELMKLYHSELVRKGIKDYSFDEFFNECRLVLLWQIGFIVIWMSIINIQEYSGRELAFVNKIFENDFIFSALEDHKVRELLPV